ncbi:MAG: ribosomal RNA small subunit methyltransferase I, partial [Burkholderiaceae bacterium]|nr:ribosomal RNA small subunit methyltransferase I [Burkholderiaceae bacterium]
MSAPGRGQLLLVPNALDLGAAPVDIQQVLPLGVLQRAAGLAHWLAEDARSTRAFLKRVHAVVPLQQPLQAVDIREL